MYVGIDFTPKRTDHLRLVEILDDDDFGTRNGSHVIAILMPCVGAIYFVRALARFDDDRDGVTDHRAHLRHEVPCFFHVESISRNIALGDLFPAVVDRRRIPTLELEQSECVSLLVMGQSFRSEFSQDCTVPDASQELMLE